MEECTLKMAGMGTRSITNQSQSVMLVLRWLRCRWLTSKNAVMVGNLPCRVLRIGPIVIDW